jgi:glycosyltransferase involved in cell wall biosynthesis
MRIAYACYWNAYAADGVSRKLSAQVAAWRELGHEVRVFCLTPAPAGLARPVLDAELYPLSSAVGRLRATGRLARDLRGWRPDVVYLRQDLWAPSMWRLVRSVPTVIEINGYDAVAASWRTLPLRVLRRVAYSALIRGAAGLVVVTPALERVFARFGKPIEVVTNGIELSAIEPAPTVANARLRLVFVGSDGQVWQGVDKLLRLAELAPELDVDVVGIPAEALAGAPPNVTVHGWLDREAYAGLIRAADVGVGPLALHRKQMEEAAALKVREYLAYGLPVLLAGDDGDFVGESPWYLLRLPNTEDTIERSLPAVRAFLERVRGRRVPREEVADRIDAHVKERRRVEFFAEVLR